MCIIIASREPNKLDNDLLERCWDRNSDGAGLAYKGPNGIVVAKEFARFDTFLKLFHKHRKIAVKNNSHMLLHFRIGTSGEKSIVNVHPFWVNKNLVFAHNGMLPIRPMKNWSDTNTFNQMVLKRFPPDFFKVSGIVNLIFAYTSGNSKLVFLNERGRFLFVHKDSGEEDATYNAWFSNPGYKDYSTGSGRNCFRGRGEIAHVIRYDPGFNAKIADISKLVPKNTVPTKTEAEAFDETCAYCSRKLSWRQDVIHFFTPEVMVCNPCHEKMKSGNIITVEAEKENLVEIL